MMPIFDKPVRIPFAARPERIFDVTMNQMADGVVDGYLMQILKADYPPPGMQLVQEFYVNGEKYFLVAAYDWHEATPPTTAIAGAAVCQADGAGS